MRVGIITPTHDWLLLASTRNGLGTGERLMLATHLIMIKTFRKMGDHRRKDSFKLFFNEWIMILWRHILEDLSKHETTHLPFVVISEWRFHTCMIKCVRKCKYKYQHHQPAGLACAVLHRRTKKEKKLWLKSWLRRRYRRWKGAYCESWQHRVPNFRCVFFPLGIVGLLLENAHCGISNMQNVIWNLRWARLRLS